MASPLPQLSESDVQALQESLAVLLEKTGACHALVIDVGGFVVTQRGEANQFDIISLAALAAGAFSANEAMAKIIEEPKFSSVYQQGENYSLLVNSIDDSCHLLIIFKSDISVGAVKYHAMPAIVHLSEHLLRARNRAPDETLDLSSLNLADTSELFPKKDPD